VEIGCEYLAIQAERFPQNCNRLLTSLSVHGARWDDINMLRRRHDRRHNQELQYSPSCSLCRRQQYIPFDLVHLRPCSRLWRSRKPYNHVQYHGHWINGVFSWHFVYARADNWSCGRWGTDQRKPWIAIDSHVRGSTLKDDLSLHANQLQECRRWLLS
jgi:hypothetical protein